MQEQGAETSRIRSIGRALKHRNYRLFFTGQSISLVGSWLTRVATSWLVYRLTHSPWLLGVVGFAGQIPTFLIAPFAGVLVERWDRRRALLATQILSAVQSALLAFFALTDRMTVWHLVALGVAQGVINAFDMPIRQTLLVQMVEDRRDLPNAIALNSSMVNGARLIGPSVAGLLIAAFGEGYCFLIDALSYVAVVVSVVAMRIAAAPRRADERRMLRELREGLRYVSGSAPIRTLLLLLALVSLMGMPYVVLMPAIAAQSFGGGPNTLGVLMAASGAGALAGALYLASRRSVLGLGRVIAASAFGFGAALAAFSFARTLWVGLPLMLLAGSGMMVQMAATNTLIQTLVDEDKRARVMSFFAMAFFGTVPFGSLAAGSLAARIGPSHTVLAGGLACILGALVFLKKLPSLRASVHPIYMRLGILPGAPIPPAE